VVTEQQVVVGLLEIGCRHFMQRLDVVGVLVKRLHRRDAQGGGEALGFLKNFHHHRLIRRHRVVRILREKQQFLHAVSHDLRHHGRDGWIAVAHRQIHRSLFTQFRGQLLLHADGSEDERRTLFGPDLLIGMR
jgi:hypothetical protein